MKKLYITLSFVIASSFISAQNKATKTADKLFDRYEYVDAAERILKIGSKRKIRFIRRKPISRLLLQCV